MNEGLKAHYAARALRDMITYNADQWWIGDDMVTRFECERVLGIGEDDEHLP